MTNNQEEQKNAYVTDGQEPKEFFTNTNVTDADTDSDMGLNGDSILKHINDITGTQYYHSALTSRTCRTQGDTSTFSWRKGDSKKSSNVKPDKGHRKNLITSSPLQEDPIHQRERTEPHGSKTYYKG